MTYDQKNLQRNYLSSYLVVLNSSHSHTGERKNNNYAVPLPLPGYTVSTHQNFNVTVVLYVV